MSLDVDSLLTEISPDAPCGEDISYDASYLELERMALESTERMFAEGESEEPDWKDVHERCIELLSRSKDLRVILYLALADLRLRGAAGFHGGLTLLRHCLEQYWDSVHPQLDPDDGNDPTERRNIISQLSPVGAFQDPVRFRDRFLEVPLCRSRQMGSYSLRDIMVAKGELPAPTDEGAKVVELSVIDAAFEDTELDKMQTTRAELDGCVSELNAIDAFLTKTLGAGLAPNLDGIRKTVREALGYVDAALERRGYGTSSSSPAEGDSPAEGASAAAPVAAPARGLSGTVNSVQDVLKAIDRICEYYERSEPSSPVPLLLKRAKRLVGKSYLDIVRDVTPDALGQVALITGVNPDYEEGS